jgi:hypothetical protein
MQRITLKKRQNKRLCGGSAYLSIFYVSRFHSSSMYHVRSRVYETFPNDQTIPIPVLSRADSTSHVREPPRTPTPTPGPAQVPVAQSSAKIIQRRSWSMPTQHPNNLFTSTFQNPEEEPGPSCLAFPIPNFPAVPGVSSQRLHRVPKPKWQPFKSRMVFLAIDGVPSR